MAECLYKTPQARPTPAVILARLRTSQRAPSPAAARLQAANLQIVSRLAREGATASAQQSAQQQRNMLGETAQQSLERILEDLIARVREGSPVASVTRTASLVVRLGDGTLTVDPVTLAPSSSLARGRDLAPFDVIAYTAIAARKPRDRFNYEGRSHSLWFCDAHDEGVYRWFETAFMIQPLVRQFSTLDPFALAPTDEDAIGAFSPVMTVRQVAWEPLPLDQGDEEPFIERWLGWLGDASSGTLSRPRQMPETSGGQRRRS